MSSVLLLATVVGMAACVASTGDGSVDSEEMMSETASDGPATRRIVYGGHADAFGDLTLPTRAPSDGWPVVVLIHGGFWRDGFFLDLMEPLVPSLVRRNVAVWSIEYRRVGAGGGFPATFEDVATAIDHLTQIDAPLDLDRVALVGHSAGGHLAVWAAGRDRLPDDAPGAVPAVRPRLAVSQAGVLDLVDCADRRVGQTACPDLLGGVPADLGDRYEVASPVAVAPIDARVLLVHGADDAIVPPRQSERYVAAAGAGADTELVVIEGAGHFEHLDPAHEVWAVVLDELDVAFSG